MICFANLSKKGLSTIQLNFFVYFFNIGECAALKTKKYINNY